MAYRDCGATTWAFNDGSTNAENGERKKAQSRRLFNGQLSSYEIMSCILARTQESKEEIQKKYFDEASTFRILHEVVRNPGIKEQQSRPCHAPVGRPLTTTTSYSPYRISFA